MTGRRKQIKRTSGAIYLGSLLGAQSSLSISNSDVELLCAGPDGCPLSAGDAVGDFGTVSTMLHHQNFKFLKATEKKN